ncbi:hypothetical protein BDN72DRAFT_903927 [Pluteus cervinus]|uniref:Uncharacterized protein n=1 Tax=Pluteus cervinus TaxID=181527 RepID=A0ACD3A7G4_9AGAR|nr:hypothetical protein BDN72DRAFT_903927 [Pluteus cervinus]
MKRPTLSSLFVSLFLLRPSTASPAHIKSTSTSPTSEQDSASHGEHKHRPHQRPGHQQQKHCGDSKSVAAPAPTSGSIGSDELQFEDEDLEESDEVVFDVTGKTHQPVRRSPNPSPGLLDPILNNPIVNGVVNALDGNNGNGNGNGNGGGNGNGNGGGNGNGNGGGQQAPPAQTPQGAGNSPQAPPPAVTTSPNAQQGSQQNPTTAPASPSPTSNGNTSNNNNSNNAGSSAAGASQAGATSSTGGSSGSSQTSGSSNVNGSQQGGTAGNAAGGSGGSGGSVNAAGDPNHPSTTLKAGAPGGALGGASGSLYASPGATDLSVPSSPGTPPGHGSHSGALIGGIIAALIVAGLLIFCLTRILRRRRQAAAAAGGTGYAFSFGFGSRNEKRDTILSFHGDRMMQLSPDTLAHTADPFGYHDMHTSAGYDLANQRSGSPDSLNNPPMMASSPPLNMMSSGHMEYPGFAGAGTALMFNHSPTSSPRDSAGSTASSDTTMVSDAEDPFQKVAIDTPPRPSFATSIATSIGADSFPLPPPLAENPFIIGSHARSGSLVEYYASQHLDPTHPIYHNPNSSNAERKANIRHEIMQIQEDLLNIGSSHENTHEVDVATEYLRSRLDWLERSLGNDMVHVVA